MTDEANAKIREALDHPVLRNLFGAIEDSGSAWGLKLWELIVPWFEIRDEALALLAEDKPIVSREMVWELENADTSHEVVAVCERFGFSVERPED